MDLSVRSAIASIEAGISRGTGFLVTQDFVLTALHVVADRNEDPPRFYGEITVQFTGHPRKATVVKDRWDRHADWALLQLDKPLHEIEPFVLRTEPRSSGSSWESYGYPRAKPDGMAVSGTLSDPDGDVAGTRALQLYALQAAAGDGMPLDGLSGAPILVDGAVVGLLRWALVKEDKGSMGGTLFACPVRMILDRCTKIILPAGLKRGAAGSDPVLAQVAPVPVARFRELKYQVFLAYSEVDTGFMRECLNLLNQRGYSIMSSPKALFAESDYDFSDLENSVRQCHTAMLLLSRASLNQLRDRSVQTGRILSILRARTGCVIPVWSGDGAPEVPSDWSLGELLIVDQTEPHAPLVEAMGRLEEVIQSCCPRPDALTIGLPVLILAMTKTEAEELERQPERLRDEFGLNIYQQFVALRSLLQGDESPPLSDRYGLRREDWKPFVTSNRTAWSVLKDIVGDLNRGPHPRSLERLIKLQYYPLVEERSGDELHRIYRQVAQTGCVVLADELSMFHWNIKKAFQAPFYNSEQASLVTLSPVNPSSMAPDRILESELRKKLEVAFNRFNRDYDPRCEFGIGDERRLRRWLHSSLPKTVQNLWNPPPVAQAMDDFFSEQGIGPRP